MSMIVRADARALPLADSTVDLIVCSPPYWGLRSYRDEGEHYGGQIGSEDSPAEFVDELCSMVDSEWRRVLKSCGSMFLNLGDKYAGGGVRDNKDFNERWGNAPGRKAQERGRPADALHGDARTKSLLGLPWRVALNLIDKGWILRSEIVWSKPNGLPESVRDRVRRSHEQVFHFVKEPKYFAAVDEIRQPHADRRDLDGATDREGYEWSRDESGTARQWEPSGPRAYNPLGRLPDSVWNIATEPLLNVPEHLPDHFAAYPTELVRRIVSGWSPPDGVILDPMAGTGTTVGVARMLGRTGIGVDLSADYCKLAKWRVFSSNHFQKVLRRTSADRQQTLL